MLKNAFAIVGVGIIFLWLMGSVGIVQFRLYVGDDFKTFCKEQP